MSHWKWRETKQHPSRARSGYQISCCLVSLHFLCDILAPITVDLLPIKSSGKTDSLVIGLKLDFFQILLGKIILSDSPQTGNVIFEHFQCSKIKFTSRIWMLNATP